MQPFNKYYPPDYDGKSNINKMAGTHALGRRARKLDQGILVVRFEMPFNIFCASCKNHIGQGVRFNAEKKRIGHFYSTPIWSFRMKCHLCSHVIEIKTDPENTRYVIVEGAKRQAEDWDTTDQGVVQPKGAFAVLYSGEWRLTVDVEEQKRLLEDPFARLEKVEDDKMKASEQHQIISKLYDISHRQWSDPYTRSQSLRKTFREEKKILKRKSMLTEEIRTRNGLHIDLLPETDEDTIRAKMVEYDGKSGREASLRRRELKSGSMVPGKQGRTGESKANELERLVKLSTRERADPFLHGTGVKPPFLEKGVKVRKKGNLEKGNSAVGVLVDGYSSDSD